MGSYFFFCSFSFWSLCCCNLHIWVAPLWHLQYILHMIFSGIFAATSIKRIHRISSGILRDLKGKYVASASIYFLKPACFLFEFELLTNFPQVNLVKSIASFCTYHAGSKIYYVTIEIGLISLKPRNRIPIHHLHQCFEITEIST